LAFAALFVIYFLIVLTVEDVRAKNRKKEGVEQPQQKWLVVPEEAKIHLKRIGIAFIVCLALWVTVPSKKDAAIIYFLPKMTNSEAATDIFSLINKLPRAIRLELEKYFNAEEHLK